jgi:hypothetical protein
MTAEPAREQPTVTSMSSQLAGEHRMHWKASRLVAFAGHPVPGQVLVEPRPLGFGDLEPSQTQVKPDQHRGTLRPPSQRHLGQCPRLMILKGLANHLRCRRHPQRPAWWGLPFAPCPVMLESGSDPTAGRVREWEGAGILGDEPRLACRQISTPLLQPPVRPRYIPQVVADGPGVETKAVQVVREGWDHGVKLAGRRGGGMGLEAQAAVWATSELSETPWTGRHSKK